MSLVLPSWVSEAASPVANGIYKNHRKIGERVDILPKKE